MPRLLTGRSRRFLVCRSNVRVADIHLADECVKLGNGNQTRPQQFWRLHGEIDHGRFQPAGRQAGVENHVNSPIQAAENMLGRGGGNLRRAVGTRGSDR